MVPDPLSGIGVLRSRYRAREYLARAKTVADCKEQYHLFFCSVCGVLASFALFGWGL